MLRAMTSDLDLYQGYLAVNLPILWIIFTCDQNTTQEGITCNVLFPNQEAKGQSHTGGSHFFSILVDH